MPLDRQAARSALAIGQRLFAPVALGFLLFAAYSGREVFAQVVSQARPLPLVLAVLGWSLLHLVTPVVAWIVLRGAGHGLSYRELLGIHLNRLPARYVPGGVWQTVSRFVDLHARGVSQSELALLGVMENLAPLATALAFGGILLSLAHNGVLPAPLIASAGLALGLALPLVLRAVARPRPLSWRGYVQVLAVTAIFWAIAASLFALYWSAFPALPVAVDGVTLAGTYLVSWSAGFIAVLAPQGLGVFEAVAALVLRGAVPFATLAALAAGFRAVALAGDGLAFLAWQLWRKFLRPVQ